MIKGRPAGFNLAGNRRRHCRLELLQRQTDRPEHCFQNRQHLGHLSGSGRHTRHADLFSGALADKIFQNPPHPPGFIYPHRPDCCRRVRRLCSRRQQHRQRHGRICRSAPFQNLKIGNLTFSPEQILFLHRRHCRQQRHFLLFAQK